MPGSFVQMSLAFPCKNLIEDNFRMRCKVQSDHLRRIEHGRVFGSAAAVPQLQRMKCFKNQPSSRTQSRNEPLMRHAPPPCWQMHVGQNDGVKTVWSGRPVFKISQNECNSNTIFCRKSRCLFQTYSGIVYRSDVMSTPRQPHTVAAFSVSWQQDLASRVKVNRLIAQKPVGLCAVLEVGR